MSPSQASCSALSQEQYEYDSLGRLTKDRRLMPDGTFSPADAVRPWDTLSDDEKRLFSRMAEVFAGYSEYTDVQIGRVRRKLESAAPGEDSCGHDVPCLC